MAQQHGTAQWLAGNQRDSSMNKQGAYLPLPLSLFASARTCSASTNHTCSHAHALSLPHSLSSLGLAQVESMLSSCAADHGHHAMHACQWPTPHHTDSPCLSPHPFFMLWCGRRDARQLHVWVCACVLHPPLCIQCVWVHTFCADLSGGTQLPPLPLSVFFFHHHIMWRRGRARGKEAEQLCRAGMGRHGQAVG